MHVSIKSSVNKHIFKVHPKSFREYSKTFFSIILTRSRNSQIFFEIVVLKNFAIFTHSMIHRRALVKRLQHKRFLVYSAKFLRTAHFIEHFLWLLLGIIY